MHRVKTLVLFVAVLSLTVAPSFAQVNQQAIDDVAAGRITEAKASWWGYNAEEATEALQTAINSGVPRLIVDNVGTPWIVDPISLVSNQEIVFEEGVEVIAKRGSFKGTNDSLFSAFEKENITLTGYGATLRMWRDDYDDPEQYTKAEWRHVLQLRGCNDINVYGLTFAESGGDGIYLGASGGKTNTNIHIKDVVCDKNYRQGISVITAENLLIEDSILKNTAGTAPQAGIDFEPNNANEKVVNCVMRNVVTENNAGAGCLIYLPPLKADSAEVSLTVENYKSINDNAAGIWLMTGNSLGDAVKGKIEFINTVIENSNGPGFAMRDKPVHGLHVRLENFTIINAVANSPVSSPIQFAARPTATEPIGGIEFINVEVHDPLERNIMQFGDQSMGVALENITGNITLVRNGVQEDFQLTEELIAEWMPVYVMRQFPRFVMQGVEFAPLSDTAPADGYSLQPAQLRRTNELVLYAREGEQVRFVVSFQQVANYFAAPMLVIGYAPSGEEAFRAEAAFQAETPITFVAPETGLYRIPFNPTANRALITESSHPINISMANTMSNHYFTIGEFFFYIPPGTTEFGIRVFGEGLGEAVRAAIYNAAGELLDEQDDIVRHQFEVELAEPSEGEIWSIRFSRPTNIAMEDFSVDMVGIPALLAASKEAILAPQ